MKIPSPLNQFGLEGLDRGTNAMFVQNSLETDGSNHEVTEIDDRESTSSSLRDASQCNGEFLMSRRKKRMRSTEAIACTTVRFNAKELVSPNDSG